MRGLDLGATASVGVAAACDGAASGEALIVEADRATHAAKAAGRDGVVLDRPHADSVT
ncbi:hypothetical protein DSM104299_02296 [Baekduia alba]|uniref:hypothetical protein n=1 Tax=Baekduia alba TaxID=2997333 RepID=UPI00233FA1AC|nr:hypothetical protein [Baekduia alba]WCB93583.1 hypothetical protein DSM104299_02296 [Baekduia alba]